MKLSCVVLLLMSFITLTLTKTTMRTYLHYKTSRQDKSRCGYIYTSKKYKGVKNKVCNDMKVTSTHAFGSIKVIDGTQITLFSQENYKGQKRIYKSSNPAIDGSVCSYQWLDS